MSGLRPAAGAAVTAALAVATAALAVAIAACSGGSDPSPATASPAPAVPAASGAPATATTPGTTPPGTRPPGASQGTPLPTGPGSRTQPPGTPGAPPAATIGDTPGSVGSYTGDGVLAGGPWTVPRSGVRARPGASLLVEFGSGETAVAWDASWAPVQGGAAGTPRAAGTGRSAVAVAAPRKSGTWSLRVNARFGEGQ
jgi:hypothetical protein